jgi:hypothetical protein
MRNIAAIDGKNPSTSVEIHYDTKLKHIRCGIRRK